MAQYEKWEVSGRAEDANYLRTVDGQIVARISIPLQGLLREFVAAFSNYVVRKEKENEFLKRQLEVYRTDTKKKEKVFADQMLGLLEEIKPKE